MTDSGIDPRTRRARLLRLLAAGLTIGALSVAATGCGGDGDDGGGGGNGGGTDEPPATQTQPSGDGDGDGGGAAAGDASAGQEVFASNCAVCHGDTGGGGSGPSLNDPQYADADRVRTQVVNGGGGMPAFGDQLSDQEIADVVAYVNEDLSQR